LRRFTGALIIRLGGADAFPKLYYFFCFIINEKENNQKNKATQFI